MLSRLRSRLWPGGGHQDWCVKIGMPRLGDANKRVLRPECGHFRATIKVTAPPPPPAADSSRGYDDDDCNLGKVKLTLTLTLRPDTTVRHQPTMQSQS